MTEYRKLISANIRKYRLLAGLSQTALAERLSVSSAAVSNWEKGQNSIDIDMLFRVCRILGVSVDDMGREDPADLVLSDTEAKTVIALRSCSSERRSIVLNILGIEEDAGCPDEF